MAQPVSESSDLSDTSQTSDSDFSVEDLTPLDKAFNQASAHVAKITSKLNNNQLLELYAFYKQSVEGKCNTPKPGLLDIRGKRKWEAWKNLGDFSRDEAKKKYIELVKIYDPDFELDSQGGSKETWVRMSLLQYSPEPELVDSEMSLFDAAREDMGKLVTAILKKNPELKDERDENGLTALHWAADRDATSALTAALHGGCSVNAVDKCDQTALHYAASCGHVRSTKLLLEAGAVSLKDDEGCTPLDLATDAEVRKILEDAT